MSERINRRTDLHTGNAGKAVMKAPRSTGERQIICCDMKSFYASVECVDRGLDPLNTNLVVADASRSDKTICLAVSPALKSFGVPGRPRLFEVLRIVSSINAERSQHLTSRKFRDSSVYADDLRADPALKLDYITAPPRMSRYLEVSNRIYHVFLKYIAPEDILVYSVDEAFMDVTAYLNTYHMSARELAMTIIRDVLHTTGITATIGIGTNLYLGKVAMDIVAKHLPADSDGVRIASLTESSYRRLLWDHRPITDFWRVGSGYSGKLARMGLYTMGDIARCSIGGAHDFYNEHLLYKAFGINAELLIDHAWGWEPCTMETVKQYRPVSNSLSSGQVLPEPYAYDKGRLIVREMADQLSLEMTRKHLVTSQITLTVSFDAVCLKHGYRGKLSTDHYGRQIPRHTHGTENLSRFTNSTQKLTAAADRLYLRCVPAGMYVRRINITVNSVISEDGIPHDAGWQQLDLFTDYEALETRRREDDRQEMKSRRLQRAIVQIRDRYGGNALLKGMDLLDGATTRERNEQVGGHRA